MSRILKWLAGALAGVAWFALVFAISAYATFPAKAVAERLRWQVQQDSGGSYMLELGSVSPHWMGVRADDFALYSRQKPRRSTDEPKLDLVMAGDTLRVRSGPFSLLNLVVLGGTGDVVGSISREGGDVDFRTTLARIEDEVQFRGLRLTGDGVPVRALSFGKLEGEGGLDLDVDLRAGEGFSKADGHATLAATELVLQSINAPGTPVDGMELGPLRVSQVDVAFDVMGGKAKVSRGQIVSDLATIDIEGDVVLADDLMNSRMRLKFVISMAEGNPLLDALMKEAKWDDGKYRYAASGTFARPRFRAERERKARPSSRRVGDDAPSAPGPALALPGIDGPRARLGGDVDPVPMDDDPDAEAAREERARRREEAIAERRRRLEERREALDDGPVRPGDEEPFPGQELEPPPPEDEPPPEFEDGPIPPEEEFPPDEEFPPEEEVYEE